ncbi:hypothetical protein JCM11491_000645 [Sporobolomyces phaffii]
MTSSHLDPLPSDYLDLVSKASVSHTTNLANVSTIIARLELARSQLAGTAPPCGEGQDDPVPSASDTLLPLSSFVKQASANAAKESKEWGNAVTRFAKSVDKKFPGPPPPLFPPPVDSTLAGGPDLCPTLLSLSPSNSTELARAAEPPRPPPAPFSSPPEISALNSTIALHLARIGAFASLEAFLAESGTPSPLAPALVADLEALHAIVSQLARGDCSAAIEWVLAHPARDPNRDLEFALRREEFVRILVGPAGGPAARRGSGRASPDVEMRTEEESAPLLASGPESTLTPPVETRSDSQCQAALAYGGAHFRPLLTPARTALICSLLTSPLFLPLPKLLSSPYGPIYTPYATTTTMEAVPAPTAELCNQFSAAFLQHVGLPVQSPLTVVTDVGSSGSIAKIHKVRQVMKEKRTEWSASSELPVEIPVPVGYRYHSIFACPVSKEQATELNPPMLLPCGHCIARESLTRLARGTPTLKCPYCPIVSHVNACVRVHF